MTVPSVETVEYGRRVVLHQIEKLKRFENESRHIDPHKAQEWRMAWRYMERTLIGPGEGCVITAFDERWLDPEFRERMG